MSQGTANLTATPSSSNAFSGIRWAVNNLENRAIEAYWIKKSNWAEIKACLETAWECLDQVIADSSSDDDCPWPSCGGGMTCRPICKE